MQKDTKKAIKDTFIELLRTKPFDKITVRDVVETCGINRNTFYYYYSDIYDLLEEIFSKQLKILLDAHKSGKSWLQAFASIANTAYEHKKLIHNICSSRSYDYFENYMYKASKHIIIDFVQVSAEGMRVPDEDIEFIASFFEYAFLGILSEWFRTGMREDPLYLGSQLWLISGNIKESLRLSEKRMKNRIENGNFV
jgi:AcrR family transcriptional regulator